MNISELCVRRPVMTTLLMLSLVMAGVFGFRELPVAALPRVDFPTISVSASLPGASPETMASAVATPLEKQFSTIAGITSMSSVSGLGSTSITLQFDLDRDIDGAALDVQSALTTASRQLPEDMPNPPSYRKSNPADQPVLFLALRSTLLPLSKVNDYADNVIAPRLATLPGVAQVQVFGGQKFAIRMRIDPRRLASQGISLNELQSAISEANSNRPVGQLSGADQTVTLLASPQLTKAEDYAKLIIAYRNGKPVRLSDVADVVDSVENDKIASWVSLNQGEGKTLTNERAIVMAVQRQPDANTVAVVDAVRALVPKFESDLPEAVTLDVMIDRSLTIRASVHDVEFTLVLTIILVVLVIFIFLRSATATFIPALAVPISMVACFGGMYLLDFSINNLTLLALTLSVGFVVDDAIVVLENIMRYVEKGEKPYQAALKGAREVGFTIVSMTVSLVAVFIPVLFMEGVIGRLFREFALTISITILLSGIVSLTLTPMLASRFLKVPDHTKKPFILLRWSEAGFNALLRGYEVTLDLVLRFRLITMLVTIASLFLSIWLYVIVPKGFMPAEDTGLISASTEAPLGVSFEAMAAAQQKVAAIIAADPAVEAINASAGAGGPNSALNNGRLFIGLKPWADREDPMPVVVARLSRKLAEVPEVKTFLQPVQSINVGGRSSRALYQFTVSGSDFAELQKLTPGIVERITKVPGVTDVNSDLQIRNPQAMVEIDRDRAAALNVTADALRDTLYSAYGTRQIATIYTSIDTYKVLLEVDSRFQQDLTGIAALYVRATDGTLVPLDSVARIYRLTGPVSVNHQGQSPAVTISFNLAQGTSLGQATTAIERAMDEMVLPDSITTGFGGTAQVFQDSLKGQPLLLLTAVLVIYIVLGILYESFIHPLTILSGLPAAGLGALLTLLVFRVELSVIAVIGIVMLIGIVKKNAIMMIDFALEARKSGAEPFDAIREACLLRFRPIMMTTMAALMGTLPIALGIGAGAELRQPLGLAVVGGLVVSQALTLYITPVIYLYLEGLRRKKPGPEGDVEAVAAA